MNKTFISVVIPTYREPEIRNTVQNILLQTVFKKHECEIIVVDYDPDNTKIVFNEVQSFEPRIKYIRVFSKGIPHARNIGCKAAKGMFLVNFDADSMFDTIYSIEYLIEPLVNDSKISYTCCDNIPITDDAVSTVIYDQLNKIQRHVPFNAIFESGFTLRKSVFNEVGGFNPEHQMWECIDLSSRISLYYGVFCKRYIEKCRVLTSDRRVSKLKTEGLSILDYENQHYR